VKKVIYIFGCLGLVLITVLRTISLYKGLIWPDTENYVNIFNWFNENFGIGDIFEMGLEPGIFVVVRITWLLGGRDRAYIVVLGILILIPIFYMIWKYSEFPCLSLFMFYAMGFLSNTSIYRQWIAIAILTFTIKYIQERRILPFLCLVFLAFLFHRTAAVFILVYFLKDFKISLKYMIVGAVVSIVIYCLGYRLMIFLNRFARIEAEELMEGGISLLIVMWIFIILAYLFTGHKFRNKTYSLMFNIVLLGATIQTLSFTFSLWSRVVLYFNLYSIILVPNTIVCVEKDNKLLSVPMGFRFVIELAFVLIMFGWFSLGGIPPYISMWEG
jgi:hypothetical protein